MYVSAGRHLFRLRIVSKAHRKVAAISVIGDAFAAGTMSLAAGIRTGTLFFIFGNLTFHRHQELLGKG